MWHFEVINSEYKKTYRYTDICIEYVYRKESNICYGGYLKKLFNIILKYVSIFSFITCYIDRWYNDLDDFLNLVTARLVQDGLARIIRIIWTIIKHMWKEVLDTFRPVEKYVSPSVLEHCIELCETISNTSKLAVTIMQHV
jgi:hypothetical protein